MIKAIVRDGVVVPRNPLPDDWPEGTEVEVEKSATDAKEGNGVHPADAWMDEVERCVAEQDPDDDLRLQQTIDEERRIAKELARQGKI